MGGGHGVDNLRKAFKTSRMNLHVKQNENFGWQNSVRPKLFACPYLH
jgi:hypothetical protein